MEIKIFALILVFGNSWSSEVMFKQKL